MYMLANKATTQSIGSSIKVKIMEEKVKIKDDLGFIELCV